MNTTENGIITGSAYLKYLQGGAAYLAENRTAVNDLNVFPIPDGDTGDNMYMTIQSGCSAGAGCTALSVSAVSDAVAGGMLLGARGNSGVILSRFFAGIAKGLAGLETATVEDLAKAMESGREEAYKAVLVPVEGTMLTVYSDAVRYANSRIGEGRGAAAWLDDLLLEAEASLERTPELLDVLKEAGVVDSGGAGLMCIIKGAIRVRDGFAPSEQATESGPTAAKVNLDAFGPDSVLEFGYCTEFLLRLQNSKVDTDSFDEGEILDYLNSVGESVVCFRDGTVIKAHVHTHTPGDILNHCQRWGEFLTLKIENMSLQHNENTPGARAGGNEALLKKTKKFGVVAVAFGDGLVQAFRNAGADFVIEGGQTMNPSTRTFIDAFDAVGASTIFVFPNNSNVVMTAQQAASVYTKSKVIVLPSKNIGAGYVAVASMDCSSGDAGEIADAAIAAMDSVTSGFVSRAVRDSHLDGLEMHCGDYIGIAEGKIVSDAPDRQSAVLDLASRMGISDHDVALVFSGADVSPDEAVLAREALESAFPDTEIMFNDGGQPVFDYILVLC